MILIKRTLFIFSILLFIITKLTAQNTSVKGTVIEKKSRLAVEFASVSILRQADSTLVTGILTKENGTFEVSIDTGRYLLNVISIGFKTVSRRGVATFEISEKI